MRCAHSREEGLGEIWVAWGPISDGRLGCANSRVSLFGGLDKTYHGVLSLKDGQLLALKRTRQLSHDSISSILTPLRIRCFCA
jgi:hypothetical protein